MSVCVAWLIIGALTYCLAEVLIAVSSYLDSVLFPRGGDRWKK